MAGLGVNIDHVATVRQARQTVEPDPIWAAAEAELGGADCITFHLRADRRHINDRDTSLLRQTVRCKLNMEMSLDPGIVDIALITKPDQATLVPEGREEVTTEGGLDIVSNLAKVKKVVSQLREAGIVVSAFIEPDADQIRAAVDTGFEAIEIHTGSYANATGPAVTEALAAIAEGLDTALSAGLVVHAGHGLTYTNVQPVAAMAGFSEFNIGHSLISRAIFVGVRQATAQMKAILDQHAPR